ncbi:ShlB/FhaC/HecB family hemolysin secretion/activation protein [Paraburkholderia sacchari]|uniref:ShlB/FhaC/HecB family hemolysin secretion/activation protein n=1 Tax=Paraburkholderia sacchari TaxID=159450 RepID=UPI001BCCEAEC|nr:ShlB/FhaC/HecB family hemolysin secretion/activation protein [Paraburkholderia sacchari]
MKRGIRTIAALACSGSALAWGQVLPNSGSLLQQTEPRDTRPEPMGGAGALPVAPPAAAPAQPGGAGGASFVLKGITLKGNDTIPADELLAPVQSKIGSEVNFADLQAIATQITQVYRARGYVLAQVVIPPQDVTSGQVTMSVLEGRVGHVRLDVAAGTPIKESLLRARVEQIPVGAPLQQQALERTMLLLSDLPGITVTSAIESGSEPGTVDLTINVAPAKRWTFAADLDNYGASTSGTWRLGGLARLNSPFGIGDNLDLRILGAERLDTVYGRAGYEAPVNAWGTRVGVAVARLNYTLGKEFSALDATGDATVVDLTVTHPLLRTRNQNLLARANLEYRDLSDNIGVVDDHNRRSMVEGSVGLTYESRDGLFGGGFNSADISLLIGSLHFKDAANYAIDQSQFGRNTAGNEVRATFFANRLNAVTEKVSLFFGFSGQWAATNLDNSSRFLLGGPHAVRAYSPSEGLVDEGFVATAEVRYAVNSKITAFTFFDFGTGWYNANPRPNQGPNNITRSGAGIGAYLALPYGFAWQGTVAWRTTSPDTTGNDKLPTFYMQLSKTF